MAENNQQRETAKAIYERLKNDRDNYTRRAEECAKVTIPALFPSDTSSSSDNFTTPYQSIGSRGVNNLANKLLLALFPPNATFFKLTPSAELAEGVKDDSKGKSELDTALVQLEQTIIKYIENNQIRVTVGEALKQLTVAGNALLYLPPHEQGIKLYKLHNYVIQRDALGNVITIVTLDNIAYAALPDELKSSVQDEDKKPDDNIEIYTIVNLEDGQYIVHQEIDNNIVSGSEGSYPIDNSPWFPLRMIKMDSENYGRSYVEEYIGDLKVVNSLSKALEELGALSAFCLYLVNPTGQTRTKSLEKAANGSFVYGREDDIGTLQTKKGNDIQYVVSYVESLKTQLGYAFMLNSSVQRNGERVTAEEIRYVAGELEDNLGGIYSILTQELQLPLVRRLISQLQTMGYIGELPEGAVAPQITTGMEALGRGHDLQKLQLFLEYVSSLPEAMSRVKIDGLLTMVSNSLGLDVTSLVKSEEEYQEEIAQMQMMQMAQNIAPIEAQQQQ